MSNLEIFLIAVATLLGPILAVQAQKMIERITEGRRRKLQIFYALMSTRATRLAPDHVQALNLIDLEFRGRRYRNVVQAWTNYSDKLNEQVAENPASIEAWAARCMDLFVDLLHELSKSLGYDFDKVQLRRGIYYPKAHGDDEARQRRIQAGLERVLSGEQAIAMDVESFPVSEEIVKLQVEAQRAILDAIDGDKAMRISLVRRARGKG